jgi:SNF2 family DNA or RNA helicase
MAHTNAALFMEMRLGKTLVCIRALQQLDLPGNVLVVAPMVGLWAWQRELQMEGEPFVVLRGDQQKRMDLCSSKTWNLINYEGLRATREVLMGPLWSAIILDESRRIANPRSQITKVLQQYTKPETRKIILSGNPAPEGPHEFFEQMRFLHGRFLGCKNFWQFRYSMFSPCGPYEWVPKPTAVGRIKTAVHSSAFVLTRKQAGISNEKIYERRVVTLNKEARRAYDKVKKEFVAEWKGREISTKWVPVQYMWLQQIASGFLDKQLVERSKFTELHNLLTGELQSDQVVVWFRFNAGLLEAERILHNAGIHCGKILGSVTPVNREQAIDDFRAGRTRVLLCQIKAAKEAIDLSVSSTAIYFSNSHSLDERVQSEDRILDVKKQEPLLYIDLVTEDTVDEDIVDLLRDKKTEARFFLSKLLERLKACK